MVTSLSVTEDAIVFSNEGKLIGKLYKHQMHPQNIAEFTKANYNLQGTVKYDAWVAGAFAGLSLLLGEHMIGPEDRALTGDGTGEAVAELVPGEIVVPETAKELQSIGADEVGTVESVLAGTEEQLGGLTPSRSPEGETFVPVSESPAAVGETIAPVSESPAAVASPEASGAVSP